jgi:hypothetical protein
MSILVLKRTCVGVPILRKGSEMRRLQSVAFFLLLFPSLLLAQRGTTGTISGAVTDPSGAVVPNGQVTATNTATGVKTSVNANASGFYSITNLEPGPYQLDVVVAGFESFEQTGIVLQVNGDVTVNVSLKVGSSTEKVTVTGEAPLVNTRDQTLSTAITPQLTEQLPLNGRNILQLMALAPDTSLHEGTSYANQSATRPESASGFVTASGASRENSTTFYLNGGLNMDSYTQVANVFPNPDAVQEFTYETNSYNAKYGGLGGGVVNAVTRGGTNQFHGTAFEYLRNGALNGRNFFSADQDTLKRNQFGGSFGGPIRKDKTFGFFSFQRTTLRYGTSANVAFGPTASELEGNWSAISQQLYNDEPGATTYATNSSTFITNSTVPFPNNQISTSLYVPLALKILQLVPMSTLSTGQIIYNSVTLDNDNQFVGRVDQNFGYKWRISGAILRDTYAQPAVVDPNNALTAAANQDWPSTHGSLNATYSIGPNLMTTLGVTLSRVLIRYNGTHDFPTTLSLGANFPDFNPAGVAETGGDFGWFSWGVDDHYYVTRNQYDFNNGWTYTRGNHMLEFGAELTLSQSIVNQDFWGNGYTASDCNYSGYSPVDFLLGQNCYYEQYDPFYDDARGTAPAIFINDAWRLHRGFTANLGLRWEPWLPWPDNSAHRDGAVVNIADILSGVHSTRYPNLPPGLLAQGDPGVPSGLAHSDWKMFDPRVGFAWDVKGDGKTSIRAGAGLYHDQPFGRMYNEMLTSFPSISAYVLQDPTVPWFSPYNTAPYNGVLPNGAYPSSSTVFPLPLSFAIGFSPDLKPPATAQWNFTIERQLGKGFLLRTAYEASESWHMYDAKDVNAAIYIPGTNSSGQLLSTSANDEQRRPYLSEGFGGDVIVDGTHKTSSFNALNISVEKRMSGGLSIIGGYRWSKCLDEATVAGFYNEEYTDPFNERLDRGLCNSDLASQLKMTVVYNLPSVRSWGFVGRNVLGGWTTSGILTWYDGVPYSIDGDVDSALTGTENERADMVGNPGLGSGRSEGAKLNEWFNIAAFQNAATGTFGDSPRNFLRGPGFSDLDFSLIRSFPLHFGPLKETQKLDFRAEFFNLFNHPNFALPTDTIGSPQFGQILATATSGSAASASPYRIIQFALKYMF